MKFAWKYANTEKSKIIKILVCDIITIVLSIIGPILSAKVIVSLTSNDYSQIFLIVIMILLVDGISNLMYYFSRTIATKVYIVALAALEVDLRRNVLKLENKCLDEKGSGVFIQRLTNDTAKIADAFQYLLGMTTDLIQYIGILVAIFIVNKMIFIYVFVMLFILYIFENMRTKKKNEIKKEEKLDS